MPRSSRTELFWKGALAQLGERDAGSVEVTGSIPVGSTMMLQCPIRLVVQDTALSRR